MGFLDELRARNTSTGPVGPNAGGLVGPQGEQSLSGVLNTITPFLHQMRNRNLEDYKAKALFDNNLSMQQGGIRRMDPNADMNGMNVVMGQNQNEITPFQRAGLGIDQQRLGLEKEKLKQADQGGDEKLALDKEKFGLEQQKNQQIYETKLADMERKSNEANQKLELAQRQLEARQGDAAAQLAFHQAQLEATKAQHALDLAQRDKALEETKRQALTREETIKKSVEDNGLTLEEITRADGTRDVKVVRKGENAKKATVTMIGPDGNHYEIPADKESDALAQGMKRQ